MPSKQTVLNVHVETQIDLVDRLAGLHLSRKATQSQVASAITFLRHCVPCQLRVDMRTDRGVMYVQAQGQEMVAFTVNPRAKVQRLFDILDD